ncbi:hypothetical protein HU200_005889 [Digitaria exilis]|uniref:non-specific serine/threonine protein kinase n=1 Tax=Digitaria exilis TaxID=1010633 RepID=A0A835FT45_9POAL|nr:hypothetical protein HU200_005889 [Digitaria exilis]
MDFSSAFDQQYFGIFNANNSSNHIFAVEIDTLLNSELRDIDANHIGIDINSVISRESHTAGYYDTKSGNFKILNLTSGEGMLLWIDYDGESTQLNVTMSLLHMSKPERPLISTISNLSTVIPEVAYMGFSSGATRTRHYILGWSFGMNKPAPAIDIASLPKLPHFGPKPRSNVPEIVLPIATGVLVSSIGLIIFLAWRRNKKYAELVEDWEKEFGPHRFSYKDLYCATQGFKTENLLGVGGFGRVYKGWLLKPKVEIAVKRVSHESKQGMKEFVAEVVSLGQIQNRNIVHLLGYCRRKGELFLVYEYMLNGSLEKYLHNKEHRPILSWPQRFRIIKGIAAGLLYLHEEWHKVVIHRDIKASNILLDSEMNARLGDFGLARLYDHGIDQQTTHVVGTIGYLAPELGCTRKPTPLTDVFSFGIFILEVVCGQRPIMQIAHDKQLMLVDWVLQHYQNGTITDTVDVALRGDGYDVDQVSLALHVGLLCSHPFKDARPSMRQVLQFLDGGALSLELTPTHKNFEMLTLMQNEGFDPYILSYPSTMTGHGSISDLGN